MDSNSKSNREKGVLLYCLFVDPRCKNWLLLLQQYSAHLDAKPSRQKKIIRCHYLETSLFVFVCKLRQVFCNYENKNLNTGLISR